MKIKQRNLFQNYKKTFKKLLKQQSKKIKKGGRAKKQINIFKNKWK